MYWIFIAAILLDCSLSLAVPWSVGFWPSDLQTLLKQEINCRWSYLRNGVAVSEDRWPLITNVIPQTTCIFEHSESAMLQNPWSLLKTMYTIYCICTIAATCSLHTAQNHGTERHLLRFQREVMLCVDNDIMSMQSWKSRKVVFSLSRFRSL